MLETLSFKQKIIFFIIVGVMLIFIIYYFYTTFYQDHTFSSKNNNTFSTDDLVENISFDETEISFENLQEDDIIVYICGAVKENKIVTLKENSRIVDAIEAAGGLTNQADLTNVNLAYILEDGEKIYIPRKGESQENQEIVSNSSSSVSTSLESSISKNKVNINKAGQAELEGIPGVGPSTALKIIQYRKENGKFSSIEDIKKVSGIGNGKFEKMKEYITTK